MHYKTTRTKKKHMTNAQQHTKIGIYIYIFICQIKQQRHQIKHTGAPHTHTYASVLLHKYWIFLFLGGGKPDTASKKKTCISLFFIRIFSQKCVCSTRPQLGFLVSTPLFLKSTFCNFIVEQQKLCTRFTFSTWLDLGKCCTEFKMHLWG